MKRALLDREDRRVLGLAVVLALAFLATVLLLAAGFGLAVRVFTLAAGW